MPEKAIFPLNKQSKEVSVLQKQLTIALKFHHSQTLKNLPKEIAVQVMEDVWNSCHPGVGINRRDPTPHDEVPVTKVDTIYL